MRDRLLVRLFLRRFVEHDLVSSNADRREVLTIAGGMLVSVSLFLSTLIALQYQFSNFLPPGITSVRSLDERFLFVSASMLVMALLAVALWDALALEARDTAVLGPLPVPRAAIVRAKFWAVALVALVTDVAWNLAPMLWRPVSLPLTLPVHFKGGMTLMLAQGAVSMSAGAFAFLAIFALREALTAILGAQRFHVVSSWLQAALLVALTSALLLLPGSYTIARTWLARGGVAARVLPPMWFVGLHETLAGSVIDDLPRVRPPVYLAVEERQATALYRSLWPLYHQLGRIAVVALAVVAVVVVIACAWNSRRLPAARAHRRQDGALKIPFRWLVTRALAPASVQQAGFWFTLQTLPRQVTHRVVLASSLAVGLSMTIIAVRGHAATIQSDVAGAPLSLLAAQPLLVAAVLTGLRLAVLRPADSRASSTFQLTWNGDRAPYTSGVKRAGWIAVVLPILALLFPWHIAVFGARVAVFHLVAGVAFSVLALELLFARYRRVPLVSSYVPVADLKSRGVAYVAAAMSVCFLFAAGERMALETAARFVVFVGLLAATTAAAALLDQSSRQSPSAVELDEALPMPTQRLDLAG